jgi:DNA-binding NarL/FixJ family response regulator
MSETSPSTTEHTNPSIPAGPCFHLESSVLACVESLANARGVSANTALHQLLDAGIRHLRPEHLPQFRKLSKKQVTVLEGLKAGHSVKEIAAQLGVLEGTVRTHIRRMRSHLNRSDLLSLRYQ